MGSNVITPEAPAVPVLRPARAPLLALTASELRIFVTAVAVIIFARFPVLFYAHSNDDYSFNTSLQPIYHYFQMTIGDGRFGGAVLLAVLHVMGLRQAETPAVSALAAALATALIGILLCRLWKPESRVATAVIVGMVTLHPYLADTNTFQGLALIDPLDLLCAVVALLWIATRPGIAIPIALLVAGCSIYQEAAGYFLVAAMTTTLLDLLFEPDHDSRLRSGWRLLSRSLAVLVTALAIYFVVNRIVMAVVPGMPTRRFGFLAVSGWGKRIGELGALLSSIFFQHEPVMQLFPKLVLLALASTAIAAVAIRLWKRPASLWRRIGWLAAIPLSLGILAVASVGVVLAAVVWWPADRALKSFAVFWAFILLAGFKVVGPRLRPVVLALGAVLCLSFAGMTNHILDDRVRANVRDALEVDRIMSRLESLPGFSSVQYLAFVGNHWTWPTSLDTIQWDANISAMGSSWSKFIFINDVTGYAFKYPTQPMQDTAAGYCAKAPLWPAEQSMSIRGNFAIICLTPK
jgi:hypothetical protein